MGKKKIVWAFDPYTDIVETWKRTEEALNIINKNNTYEIEPTYVLGSDVLKWVGNVTPPQVENIRPFVDKTLQSRLSDLKITGLKVPEVIETLNTSKSEDVQSLIEHVNKVKPELLVLNTHARTGIKRFFMGSFAENVLLKCEMPVLFLNPEMQEIKKLKKALFPTDFSENSFDMFKNFIEDFKDSIDEVVVFTKVLRPINAFAEAGVTALGGAWIAPEQYLEQEKQVRSEDSSKWIDFAKANNVEVELVIDDGLGDVVDAVIEYEKNVDFVVMSSESSAVESFVIGSIARGVIRASNKPVLACRY